MNKTAGLRFDIYERVHLSENEQIEQLEQIELVPKIEMNVNDTQAFLSGHLQLSGSYKNIRSETQQFEHRIPVEITLPLNRIKNAEQMDMDIENLDVELLSARTLNVTGVLLLNGIELDRPESVNWGNEDAVFVHEKEPDQTDDEQNKSEQKQSSLSSDVQPLAEKKLEVDSDQPKELSSFRSEEQEDNTADSTDTELNRIESKDFSHSSQNEAENQATTTPPEKTSTAEPLPNKDDPQTMDELQSTQSTQSNDEIKVAFSQKENDESNDFTKKITSLLNNRPDENDSSETDEQQELMQQQLQPDESSLSTGAIMEEKLQKQQHLETDEREEQSGSNAENGLEWKKLFLSQEEEEANKFSKLKMCIVQKDETLESIAERYQLNPREILLYNRLNDQTNLKEGQIVYIPQVQE